MHWKKIEIFKNFYIVFLNSIKGAAIQWIMLYTNTKLLMSLPINYIVSNYTCLLHKKWSEIFRWGDMNLGKVQIKAIWKFYYRIM